LHNFTDTEILTAENAVECYPCSRKTFEHANLPLDLLVNDHFHEEEIFL